MKQALSASLTPQHTVGAPKQSKQLKIMDQQGPMQHHSTGSLKIMDQQGPMTHHSTGSLKIMD
eukprot:1161078-Pelagomonas_calceolata.AAC.16